MNHANKMWRRSLAVSVLLLGLLPSAALSEETSQAIDTGVSGNTRAVNSELETMARVVEDSITQAGLKDWQAPVAGLDIFEPLTKAQYIPTVGAIFTLGVNFCITEPQAPKAQPELPSAPEDLWEKYSVAPAPGSPAREAITSALTKTLGSLQIGVTTASQSGNAGYNAEKVRMLRQSVVAALAKYGHRIEHVKESERILVVVEAPKSTPLQLGEVTLPDSVRVLLKLDSAARKGAGIGGVAGVGGAEESGRAPSGSSDGPLRLNLSWPPNIDKDSLLIAVKKADVMSSVPSEQLQGKVEEIHY